jgi:hypothetical protein
LGQGYGRSRRKKKERAFDFKGKFWSSCIRREEFRKKFRKKFREEFKERLEEKFRGLRFLINRKW